MSKYSLLSEDDLLTLLKNDDKLAFSEIYDRNKLVLHMHALNKTRDREEAKDIIQEVFISLWDKRKTIVFNNNLSGYLYVAVRNTILNKFAHKQVQEKYLESMRAFSIEQNIQSETDHRIRERQLAASIEQEIAHLPPKMRDVFELTRKAYLSHKEVAEKLNISEQTVSKQISNALKILKVKLGVFLYLCLLPGIW